MEQLTSVHQALHRASIASKPSPGKPFSFRLDDELRAQCAEICERHGTTISEFFRQCAASLVADYGLSTREE